MAGANYWLASRYRATDAYYVNYVGTNGTIFSLQDTSLLRSDYKNITYTRSLKLSPILTLQSSIKLLLSSETYFIIE